MTTFWIRDLSIKKPDSAERVVTYIYARSDPKYAVYQTEDRVTIQYSDAPDIESTQRSRLSSLALVRAEINGLMADWRDNTRYRYRVKRYDARVAAALIEALEDNLASALPALTAIRDELVADRMTRARFLYLLTAAIFATVIAAGSIAISNHDTTTPCAAPFLTLLHATAAGALGAFFSVVITTWKRSIRTDLNMRENCLDASLRIAMGVISAAFLQALFSAGLVDIDIAGIPIGSPEAIKSAGLTVFIVGFVAGFAERLVPDMLDKSAVIKSVQQEQTTPPAAKSDASGMAGDAKSKASARPPTAPADPEDTVDGDANPDHPDTTPPTPDDQLPAASGGVARS